MCSLWRLAAPRNRSRTRTRQHASACTSVSGLCRSLGLGVCRGKTCRKSKTQMRRNVKRHAPQTYAGENSHNKCQCTRVAAAIELARALVAWAATQGRPSDAGWTPRQTRDRGALIRSGWHRVKQATGLGAPRSSGHLRYARLHGHWPVRWRRLRSIARGRSWACPMSGMRVAEFESGAAAKHVGDVKAHRHAQPARGITCKIRPATRRLQSANRKADRDLTRTGALRYFFHVPVHGGTVFARHGRVHCCVVAHASARRGRRCCTACTIACTMRATSHLACITKPSQAGCIALGLARPWAGQAGF